MFRQITKLVAMSLMLVALCAPCYAESADELTAEIAVLTKHITQQNRNILKMREELAIHPTNPDTKKLGKFFATAAGYRDPAYYQEPQYIRDIIDRIEKDKILGASNFVAMTDGKGNIAVGHYNVEIERSQKFVRRLLQALEIRKTKLAAFPKSEGWKQCLGTWRAPAGSEIKIFQDETGIQCQIMKRAGNLAKARVAELDWMFEDGQPSPSGNEIISNKNFTYVLLTDCLQLAPHKSGRSTTRCTGPNTLVITSQVYMYYETKCKWSNQFNDRDGTWTRVAE